MHVYSKSASFVSVTFSSLSVSLASCLWRIIIFKLAWDYVLIQLSCMCIWNYEIKTLPSTVFLIITTLGSSGTCTRFIVFLSATLHKNGHNLIYMHIKVKTSNEHVHAQTLKSW